MSEKRKAPQRLSSPCPVCRGTGWMNNASRVKPAMVVASYEGRPRSVSPGPPVRLGDGLFLLLMFVEMIHGYRLSVVVRYEVQRLVDREANRIARLSVPRMIVYFVNQSERFMDESVTIRARCVPECCINALGS